MSATGRKLRRRGEADQRRDRVEHDDYPTPHYCLHRLLERLRLPPGRWLEPAAGRGDLLWASSVLPGIEWTAIEIREECFFPLRQAGAGRVLIGDFFSLVEQPALGDLDDFDIICGNVPFNRRTEFVEFLVEKSRPDAWVALLLPLSHAGSQRRGEWLRHHAPDVYVIPDRPPFRFGGTDAEVYGWFVWPPYGHEGEHGTFEVLALTPEEVRAPHRLFATACEIELAAEMENAA